MEELLTAERQLQGKGGMNGGAQRNPPVLVQPLQDVELGGQAADAL